MENTSWILPKLNRCICSLSAWRMKLVRQYHSSLQFLQFYLKLSLFKLSLPGTDQSKAIKSETATDLKNQCQQISQQQDITPGRTGVWYADADNKSPFVMDMEELPQRILHNMNIRLSTLVRQLHFSRMELFDRGFCPRGSFQKHRPTPRIVKLWKTIRKTLLRTWDWTIETSQDSKGRNTVRNQDSRVSLHSLK